MTREQELECILTSLFTLAPSVKQQDWNDAYEKYKDIQVKKWFECPSCKKVYELDLDYKVKHD